ncbi:MAG: CoA-binding protein [Halobacteriota archaeon]|nr:CoA-binding protein [Halobacteriota archaeon]
MSTEQESFWDANSFVVVTDKTKPAMKWTIKELTKREKKVHVVDISDKPDDGTLNSVSELPQGVDGAVIGVTKIEPAKVMQEVEDKGIKNIWIHFRTETPEVEKRCSESQIECITGRCPMTYLGGSFGMHGIHRGIRKLTGKY